MITFESFSLLLSFLFTGFLFDTPELALHARSYTVTSEYNDEKKKKKIKKNRLGEPRTTPLHPPAIEIATPDNHRQLHHPHSP